MARSSSTPLLLRDIHLGHEPADVAEAAVRRPTDPVHRRRPLLAVLSPFGKARPAAAHHHPIPITEGDPDAVDGLDRDASGRRVPAGSVGRPHEQDLFALLTKQNAVFADLDPAVDQGVGVAAGSSP